MTVEDAAAGKVRLAGEVLSLPGAVSAAKGADMAIALRPEALRLGREPGYETVLPGVIEDVHFMGSIIRLRAKVAGETVVMDTFNRADQPPPVAGTAIEISLSGKDAILLNG